MRVLGINTTGDACDTALVESLETDTRLVASRIEAMGRGHDARLAPVVAALLAESGVSIREIDRIAVVVGPGSFTGVRVGVAFARGLALVAGRAAIGVTSLEAFEPAPPGRVLAIMPAKRRPPDVTWWAQCLLNGVGEGEPIEADAARLAQLECGSGEVWGEAGDAGVLLQPINPARPSAAAAARFALRIADPDRHPPVPVYVREPDATPARHR